MQLEWQTPELLAHADCLARSHERHTGRPLIEGWQKLQRDELARTLFTAPFVLVSHGTQADPVLNYGNATALKLWEMDWADFTQTPSRLTAEPPNRDERARLLAEVTARGFIDNYSGIRISSTGKRFRIERATVWNLVDAAGRRCGQAATFRDWIPL